MNYSCLTAYVTAIANIFAEYFTDDELAVLAVLFTQLGDTLATITTLKEVCDPTSKQLDEPL